MLARRRRPLATTPPAEIQAAVARGKADIEAGSVVDAEEAFAELEEYFRTLARSENSKNPRQ